MDILYHGNNTIVSYPDYRILYIPCKPNTDYTVQKLAGQRLRVGFTDELPQAGVTISNAKPTSTNGTNDTQVTSTSGENSKYLCVWYWYKTEDKQALLDSIQIEVGSTATSYSPYTSQTYTLHLGDEELAKIGSYQDKIYYDNGKWYKYGAIGKYQFTGDNTEGWTLSANYTNNSRFSEALIIANKTYTNCLSNYFIKGTAGTDTVNIDINGSNGRIMITIPNTIATTVNELTSWLSTNNLIVYYVLVAASTTEITNTTLLQDLNYIKEHIKSFPDTTNISTSGNLPIIITASALKQLS